MKKHFQFLTLLLVACFALAALPAAGQRYFVTGRAVDDSLRLPVPFLAAQLFLPDSTLYAVSLTDSLGRFSVETDRPADYELLLTGTGFDPVRRPVRLTAGAPRVDLGDVPLHDRTIHLAEAAVTGKASTLTIRRDTFIYSSKAMDLDAGATLAAMLSQMPGVTMDDEGNILWQGKKVESILVGGRKFLGGDIQAALRNLPAEVVESLKLYDRSSEAAERTGVDDGERTTVIDVGIKPEYRGAWAGNADVGAGYEEKWTGRVFLSNFSDRLKIGVAGSANNLNGGERVTPNGDWFQSVWNVGWTTYRNASASLDWSNRDDRRSAGYQNLTASFRYNHDNQDWRSRVDQENYLPGTDHVWWHERSRTWIGTDGLDGGLAYRLNIDTLSFLSVDYNVRQSRQRRRLADRTATFGADPEGRFPGDPVDGALDPALPDSLRGLLVNAMRKDNKSHKDNGRHFLSLTYMHRLRHTQNMLAAGFQLNATRGEGDARIFYDGRYFTDGVRREPNRQYNTLLDRGLTLTGTGGYRHQLAKSLWWNNIYTFTFARKRENRDFYRLESLPGWDDLTQHPLDELPGDLAGRPDLLDENTYGATLLQRSHELATGVSGETGKMELRVNAEAKWAAEAYRYDRPAVLRTTRQRYGWSFGSDARLRYRFTDRTTWELNCRGNYERPKLEDMLPVDVTANPQEPRRGNPDLEPWYTYYVYSRFSTFFEESQVSLAFSGYAEGATDAVADRMDYDPATGYYTQMPVNVGSRFSAQAGMYLTWTLDQQKRWTYDGTLRTLFQRTPGYVGAGGEAELNRLRRTDFTVMSGLAYRADGLFVKVSAGFMPEFVRSPLQPESDETGYTYTYGLTASYTLPWGMKLSSDFEMTGRRHYRSALYNRDEPVWNAYVQQDFLKDKSLTLKLEAADMLDAQEDIYRYATAYASTVQQENGFQRYVVLHVVWRFSGKRR